MTTPRRTYVLDTSVLVADPLAIGRAPDDARDGHNGRFEEHAIVVPIRVVEELEGLRSRPGQVGWAAREALRNIESYRVVHGSVTTDMPVNDDGGTFRVEINNIHRDDLHETLRGDTSDNRIVAVAANLGLAGADVVLVSKDAPMRIRASIAGVAADAYRNEKVIDSGWTGIVSATVTKDVVNELFTLGASGMAAADAPAELASAVANTCFNLSHGTGGCLARMHGDKRIRVIDDSQYLGNNKKRIRPRNAEQRFAVDLLRDPEVKIVSLVGAAGTGKTMMAAMAGLTDPGYDRVQVFRPIDAVAGQELGFLPGGVDDKIAPYVQAIRDSLEVVYAPHEIDSMMERRSLTVEPITYVRGRTLRGWVVVDELQNVERIGMEVMLNRMGEDSKVILCADPSQVDNPRAGADPLNLIRERMKGHPIFGHVTLRTPERSEIAKAVNAALYSQD